MNGQLSNANSSKAAAETVAAETVASDHASIGLADFINQVKQELLSSPPGASSTPTHFVESVEIEMQVTVSKEGNAGVKLEVPVFKTFAAEAGARLGRADVQKVTVKLAPLYSKEELLDWYLKLNPGEGLASKEAAMHSSVKHGGEPTDSQAPRFG